MATFSHLVDYVAYHLLSRLTGISLILRSAKHWNLLLRLVLPPIDSRACHARNSPNTWLKL
jgi:hypothetical protein